MFLLISLRVNRLIYLLSTSTYSETGLDTASASDTILRYVYYRRRNTNERRKQTNGKTGIPFSHLFDIPAHRYLPSKA